MKVFVPLYCDHLFRSTSWVDPRVFAFVLSLPTALQQRISTVDAPPALALHTHTQGPGGTRLPLAERLGFSHKITLTETLNKEREKEIANTQECNRESVNKNAYLHSQKERMRLFSKYPPFVQLCENAACVRAADGGCLCKRCTCCCTAYACPVHAPTHLSENYPNNTHSSYSNTHSTHNRDTRLPLLSSHSAYASLSSASAAPAPRVPLRLPRGTRTVLSRAAQTPAQNAAASFSKRADALAVLLKTMHPPESTVFLDKPRLRLRLTRESLLADSFRELLRASPARLRLRLKVEYVHEGGVDYGGLAREWFLLVTQALVDPRIGLFTPAPSDPGRSVISPRSALNPSHLLYFRFVGRVLAKALYDSFTVSCAFTPSFYKQLQGKHVSVVDLAAEDAQAFRSLCALARMDGDNAVEVLGLSNSINSNNISNNSTENATLARILAEEETMPSDPTPISDLDLRFTCAVECGGAVSEQELLPHGRCIPVTRANKSRYLALTAQFLLVGRVKPQMDAVRLGFSELVPPAAIEPFTHAELHTLLCGSADFDVSEWRSHTLIRGFAADSPQVRWFWEILQEMNSDERARVFQFVTGTARLPSGGFRALVGSDGPHRFEITRSNQPHTHLPLAHTCFNQLALPEYLSRDELQQRLSTAVEAGLTGFSER